jgi:hypothetical protein
MATIPTPRSYSQILGGMLNTFLTRLGLPSIKTGDPSLSIMEAAAQSDFRSTKDIFDNLSSSTLDGATGVALNLRGQDARVPRIPQSPANGRVTIGDSSFDKVETRIYQGGTGVTAGSTIISIESSIPTNGELYIGRGTSNSEGPIAYTTVTPSGSFFLVALSNPTTNYHQSGESVVYAQGGDRLVVAGTTMSTPTTSAGAVVSFRSLFDATIVDGDTEITNVEVEALLPGSQGNVPRGALNTFATLPFVGATVTNPLPFDNGTDTEDEETYKARIRLAEKSRAKAIKDAIVYGLVGARALDESGSILSVSTSFRNGEPRTLYIDDGTGYQEKDEGVISESLIDDASGGEQFFKLSNRPVAKAYLKTRNGGPFTVVANSTLTLDVGGEVATHSFGASAFRDINNASAYEVAASVNSNGALPFAARVCDAGLNVAFYGKEESEEDIGWVENSDTSVTDANEWLQLPLERAYTLYLYKNDVLLYEDGREASVLTKPQSDWPALSSGIQLNIAVDGVPLTVTFSDIDFVNAGTPFTTVSSANTLASWASVFTYKIAGVTASVVGSRVQLTSNLGRDSRASLDITGGLGSALFEVPRSAEGLTSDYSLDRNSGDIKLTDTLVSGDSLVAGSSFTDGFLSTVVGTLNVAADAEFWFVVDGSPTFPVTGVSIGTDLTWDDVSSPAWGQRVSITSSTLDWAENILEGDWLIVTDPAVAAGDRGIFRIAGVPSDTQVIIERPPATFGAAVPYTLTSGGLFVVRSESVPQKVVVPAGAYSATTLAAVFTAGLPSITATALGTSLRLSTNSSEGDLTFVAGNDDAIATEFAFQTIATSGLSHRSYVQSNNSEFGGSLNVQSIAAVASTTQFTGTGSSAEYLHAKFLRPLPDGDDENRRSNQDILRAFATTNAGTFVNTTRAAAPKEYLVGQRFMVGTGFDLSARDTLQLLIDNDTVSGRYNVDMFRRAKIVNTAGGYELEETNGDSLALDFGTGFNWQDYMMALKPRVKSHSSPDTTSTVLWRWWRHDLAGGRVQYAYPEEPSTAVSVAQGVLPSDVLVSLGSSAARATPNIRTTSKLGVAITALAAGLYTYHTVASLAVASVDRVIRISYASRNTTAFAGVVTGTTSGATANVTSDSLIGGVTGSGYLIVTGVVGTFLSNETITAGAASATTTSSIYGFTEMALTLPGAITDHGLQVGDTVYSTVANADFVVGARLVAERTANKIRYVDTVATTASVAGIGSLSHDVAGEVTVAAPVVTGDIWSANTTMLATDVRAIKITLGGAGRDWTGQHYLGQAVSTTLTWYSGGGQFYPLDAAANVITALSTSVNGIANSPVSAVAIGVGGVKTGVISNASWETAALGGVNPWYDMVNTTGWIQSHNTPATTADNYIFQLRDGGLAAIYLTNADLENDDVRLVPRSALNVAQWLNSTAVSGLANRGGAFTTDAGRVQIHSEVLGGISAVQVGGGSANITGTAVQGSAYEASGKSIITVSLADGISSGQLVIAQNAIQNDKNVFKSTTTLVSIATDGTITTGVDRLWTRRNALTDGVPLLFERVGDFMLVTGISGSLGVGAALNLTGALNGDWLYIQESATPVAGVGQVSVLNQGFFRILAVMASGLLIDSPNGLSEQCEAKVDVLAYDSLIPGDTVSIGATTWGNNLGTREVTALGATEFATVVNVSEIALTASGAVAALGVNSGYFRATEASPHKALFSTVKICPNGSENMDIQCVVQSAELPRINETYGTTIIPVNKLEFPTTGSSGRDSYKKNTGLIAEANKIVFGDEANSTQYAGIASAGASYNINGPLVKRITVALAIRPITGVSVDNIRQSVQSAVAAAVNKTPVGKPVAISKLVAAAETVNGVAAVSVSSPAYNVGQDQIPVQAYEKALVLDVESDITVSFIGE